MNETFTAKAQLAIGLYFITGFFAIVVLILTKVIEIPTEFRETANALLTIMGANVGLIVTYFFQRMRAPTTGDKS